MAGTDYNGIEGLFRILAAGDKTEDTFAIEVLTFHAALEHEINVVLSHLLNRPDAILKGKVRLSFPQKAKLLVALWKGDPETADKLNEVLKAFEDLRNEVAHMGDGSLKSLKASLDAAYREIVPTAGDDTELLEIAQGTAVYMADGSDLQDFKGVLVGLDKLVNEDLMKILGPGRVEYTGDTDKGK
jgi:hypothetical protein